MLQNLIFGIDTTIGFVSLLILGTFLFLAHQKNIRKSTKETHEKGVKRDKQKYKDKKRKTENWVQNPNAKPKKTRKK